MAIDRTPWQYRAIVMVAGTPAAISLAILAPVANKIEMALGQGDSASMMTRFAITVAGLAMLVGATLGGIILDRIGPARLLRFCVAGWIILGLVCYFANSLETLIALRFCQGALAGAIVTAGVTMMGGIEEEGARAGLAGYQVVVSAITSFSITALSGIVGDHEWRWVFGLHLVAIPLLWLAFVTRVEARGANAPEMPQKSKWIRMRDLPIALGILAFVAGAVGTSGLTYMPFRLRELGLERASEIGLVLTLEAIVAACVAGFFGFARRHWLSARGALILAFTTGGSGAILAGLAGSLAWTYAGLLLFGLGVAWMSPNIISMASGAFAVEGRGGKIGFIKAMNLSSAFIMSTLLEPVIRMWGPGAAMVVLGLMGVGVAVAGVFLPRHIWFGTYLTRPKG